MRTSTARARRGWTLALVLAATLPACAPEPSGTPAAEATPPVGERSGTASGKPAPWPPQPQYTQALRERAQAHGARGDGRGALAAALVLATVPNPEAATLPDWSAPQARELLQRARERAPDDPLVAWVELSQCPDCDQAALLARLQRLEPDNAAVWLHSTRAATDAGDTDAAVRHLHRAAASRRYDWQFETLGALVQDTLRGLPLPAPTAAQRAAMPPPAPATTDDMTAVQAMAVATLAIPAFQPFQQVCLDAARRPIPARRADCIAVGMRLAGARDLLSQSVAAAYLEQLTAGTPAQATWTQRRRELTWLRERASPLVPASAEYWGRVFREGEVPAMQALLRGHGEPATPPADWVAESSRPAPDA